MSEVIVMDKSHIPVTSDVPVNSLKSLEETLIKNLDTQFQQLLHVLMQKDQEAAATSEALIASSCFETSLCEAMLKDMYCRDKKLAVRYNELRSAAAAKIGKHFDQHQGTEALELQETVKTLHNELDRLSAEVNTLQKTNAELQRKYELAQKSFTEANKQTRILKDAMQAYIYLTEWLEKRAKETPDIQRKNSGFIIVQSWEGAMAEFEEQHPRPSVPNIDLSSY